MKTIYKYPLNFIDEQTIHTPALRKILSVQMQKGHLCLWVEVDNGSDSAPLIIRIVGTGHPFLDADYCTYVGTVQVNGGAGIFHVYQKVRP